MVLTHSVPWTARIVERLGFSLDVQEEPSDSTVYEEFCSAIGPDALRAAYGSHWPRPAVVNEWRWSLWLEGQRAGWLSLTADELEQVMWLSTGVWPGFAHRQVARWATRWGVAWSFDPALDHVRLTGTTLRCFSPQAVCLRVLDTNPGLQAKFKTRPGLWSYAGRIELPKPGSMIWAITREEHESRRPGIAG